MTLSPILSAPLVIQLHVIAAIYAMLLGPAALYFRPGAVWHKYSGYAWVGAMAVVAVSSFGIHSFAVIGPFSPLHGLAVFVLWSLWQGVRCARAGRIRAHRRVFHKLYWFGVMVAGLFNFLPGRAINRALLPNAPDVGYGIIAVGLGLGFLMISQHLLHKVVWKIVRRS